MTIDCGSVGMVCSNGSGNPGCGFGDCSALEEGQTFCVGPNYVAQCTGGRYEPKLDCQTFGGSCVGPDRTAHCQGTGATCVASAAGCVGSRMVLCLGGLQGGIDCAAAYDQYGTYGFKCLVDDGGAPTCAVDTACDPATSTDSCTSGTIVDFCNAGAPGTYNCSSFWNFCDAGHCIL
jgi:hypothetical protein